MKSTLFIAALFAATTASAQSSLLLPNNSAGTEMDTPPVLQSTPSAIEPPASPSDAPRDFVIRDDAELLAGPKESDPANELRDGRPEDKDARGLRDAPAPLR